MDGDEFSDTIQNEDGKMRKMWKSEQKIRAHWKGTLKLSKSQSLLCV